MKFLRGFVGVGLCVLLAFGWFALASAADSGGPIFREINITGGEFVVIQNPTDGPVDLGSYWLGYVSDDAATAGPSEQLPDVTLSPSEAIILSNNPVNTCGAVASGDLPFSLANSNGTIALWHYDSGANPASFSQVESISWGKSNPSGPNYLNIDDEDNVSDYYTDDANASWLKPLPTNTDSTSWQVGNLDECQFTPVEQTMDVDGDGTITAGQADSLSWPANHDYPPFTMLPTKYVGSAGKPGPVLPAADKGLKAPMINELLPNPASPETDAEDEFVELYNPNSRSFDLSGFEIQTGSSASSRRHHFKIPAGTIIKAKGFKVFKSGDTKISLTNGGGQAWLLDPFGKVISKSGVYGEADDGMAFAMASGKWYWTFLPTPGKANAIQQPGGKISGSTGSNSKTPTVKREPITAIKGDSTDSDSLKGASTVSSGETPAPVHAGVLALVAALALGYGVYEYRHDLGNKFHQLRKYREARRAGRR